MSFCALEEAFLGPANPAPPGLKKKHRRVKGGGGSSSIEGFVPAQLSGTPDPDRPALAAPQPQQELLTGPPTAPAATTDAVQLDDLFPMPGDTGDTDVWERAFTLDGSKLPGPVPTPRRDGSVPVDGQSTLWRQIPVPVSGPAAETLAPIPNDINRRLDALTRQLESLTAPAPIATTAELFLFIAIGLLVLLAIDTILRFAVAMATGRRGGGGGFRGGGFRGRRFWH